MRKAAPDASPPGKKEKDKDKDKDKDKEREKDKEGKTATSKKVADLYVLRPNSPFLFTMCG